MYPRALQKQKIRSLIHKVHLHLLYVQTPFCASVLLPLPMNLSQLCLVVMQNYPKHIYLESKPYPMQNYLQVASLGISEQSYLRSLCLVRHYQVKMNMQKFMKFDQNLFFMCKARINNLKLVKICNKQKQMSYLF